VRFVFPAILYSCGPFACRTHRIHFGIANISEASELQQYHCTLPRRPLRSLQSPLLKSHLPLPPQSVRHLTPSAYPIAPLLIPASFYDGGSAQADSSPTVAGDGPAPHLAPSGEMHPTPDPSHRMSRQTATVAQLYTEWFTGLSNKPSVVWMDRQFGTRWRGENKEKVFYSVWKTIIDRVEDRLRSGESLDMPSSGPK
jgi:transcriptional activator of glycolytic enzymes GCR1